MKILLRIVLIDTGEFSEFNLLTIAVPNTLHGVHGTAEASSDGPQT
jgi:hypothetical protein